MRFFRTIKSSVYDPEFYKNLSKKGLGSSIGYFFLIAIFLTIINSLVLARDLLVTAPQELRKAITEAVNSYPSDLVVEINDGKVSTNAPEPFFVPFPDGETESTGQNINNLLVIDTKTAYSAAQFEQYKTLIWVTQDTVFYQDNNEFSQRSIDLSKVGHFKVDRDSVNSWVETINPYLRFVGPMLLAIVGVGMFIGFSFNLVYFLFLAVLIFFLSSIFKWGLKYGDSYKTAIYSSTLAFFVDLVIFNTGFYTGFFGFPFLFTLISLCVTTINFQAQNK